VFVSGFALHPSGRLAANGRNRAGAKGPVRGLFTSGIVVVIAGVFGIGLVFGSTLTSLTSLMNDLGRPEQAGLVYGVLGIGSA
ncbi:MFS transporter, partial [Mycobacterium tuberculosis]|nr:MFS transporter [Mycobacterium tuberculosis]